MATGWVDPRKADIGAATANTAMQIGSSVGTAVLNIVAVNATRGFVGPPIDALVHGSATATGWAAVALVGGPLLVVAGLRPAAPLPQQTPGGSR